MSSGWPSCLSSLQILPVQKSWVPSFCSSFCKSWVLRCPLFPQWATPQAYATIGESWERISQLRSLGGAAAHAAESRIKAWCGNASWLSWLESGGLLLPTSALSLCRSGVLWGIWGGTCSLYSEASNYFCTPNIFCGCKMVSRETRNQLFSNCRVQKQIKWTGEERQRRRISPLLLCLPRSSRLIACDGSTHLEIWGRLSCWRVSVCTCSQSHTHLIGSLEYVHVKPGKNARILMLHK